MRLILRLLITAVALWCAVRFVDGISFTGNPVLLLAVALVFGVVNTIVKPIVTLLALPLVILTLGIGLFAINVAMLALAEWISPNFSIDGFWTYVGATIVVWLLNWILHGAFGLREDSRFVRARARSTVFD